MNCTAMKNTITDDQDGDHGKNSTRFIAVSDWPKHHPWPPIGGLRHLIFNSRENGFALVLRRVGRRILINEKKFFEYIEEKNAEWSRKSGKNE